MLQNLSPRILDAFDLKFHFGRDVIFRCESFHHIPHFFSRNICKIIWFQIADILSSPNRYVNILKIFQNLHITTKAVGPFEYILKIF